MKQELAVMVALGLLAGSAAWAQDPRAEIGGRLGWTFSDGVSGEPVEWADGNVYGTIGPADSLSYGAQIGIFVTRRVEVGFLWARQQSKLELGGARTTKIDDMAVSNYHAYAAFNFGDHDDTIRPYVLGGVGATAYSNVSLVSWGQDREIHSPAKLTTTWGLGMKVYLSPKLGLNFGARWTPTYIWYSASVRGTHGNIESGWWCQPWWDDPEWECFVAGDGQYSNQLELSGGVTLRF